MKVKNWKSGTGSYKIDEINIKQGELVINGGFDTDNDWAKQGATTISNGFANINESTIGISVINQSGVANLKPYTRYIMSYDVVNWVSGNIRMRIDNNYSALLLSNGNGHYSMEMQTGSINSPIRFITAENNTVLSIDNVSVIEIPALPDLATGAKYLENTTAGTIALPSKTAYGTWEFDLYKSTNGNDISIVFINKDKTSTINDGSYSFQIKTNNAIGLAKLDSPAGHILCRSADYYISVNTWYSIKIARLQSKGTFASIVHSMTTVYPADTFAVFIKGGDFGTDNWTLVDTNGGSGSNPVTDSTYTTSNYLVTDLDAGDRFTNLKIYNGVKQ